MLPELLILATVGMLLATVGLVLMELAKAQLSWWRFQRDTKGLPMSDGRNILCNHAIRWGLCSNISHELKRFNDSIGGPKTVGWLLGTQYAACTVDLNLMKRIVLDQPNKNINRTEIKAPLAEYMEDNIMLASGDQWRRLRRAVAPALRANKFKSPNVLAEIEGSISKLVESLENKFAQLEAGKSDIVIELDDLMHRYSLNLVFSCFYKQYDQVDFNSEQCHWTRRLDEGLESVAKSALVRWGLMLGPLRVLLDWFIWNFHAQGEWRRELLHFIQRQTQLSLRARKELEELRAAGRQVDEDDFELSDGSRFQRNMADHMTDHLLDGKISRREYFNTASFLIAAGDKTVVDSIVYTIYRLAIDPDGVQEKLRDSVRKDGAESVYLDWVVSESLRLMPPAPVACSRTVVDELELEDGKRLPPGTFVAYPNYIIHRLKAYWGEDADEFKPERWRDTSHHHPLQYVPFGAGVRKCPGREFALFEMKELIAKLLVRYKFHSDPRADAENFYAPFMIFLLHESPTIIKIARI